MVLNSSTRACVTGGCGFIGSHVVRALLERGCHVRTLDNLSVGTPEMLPGGDLEVGDIRHAEDVERALRGCNLVVHLAAPTDVRKALTDPYYDMDHGVHGTQMVLEKMRAEGIRDLIFASSSCVYGSGLPSPASESMGPLFPSSVYGASKLACEGLISAYCRTFGMRAWIYRFPNVVGRRVTHGVIRDFVERLKADSTRLKIFGNGGQTKTYLWIDDCVEGMLRLTELSSDDVNLFNVTAPGSTSVNRIADLAMEALGLSGVPREYTGGELGWKGDVAYITLDPTRAERAGWKAGLDSDSSVRRTISVLLAGERGQLENASASH